MLWAVKAMPSRWRYSSISDLVTVLFHPAITESSIVHSSSSKPIKSTQLEQQSNKNGKNPQVFALFGIHKKSLLRAKSLFSKHHQCRSTRCISAVSVQGLLSPIAVCWKLHPPTTLVEKIVIWLLSLFGLSNQGKEKSSCYIHAAVLTALCPYVSPSAWRASVSDLNKKKVKTEKKYQVYKKI